FNIIGASQNCSTPVSFNGNLQSSIRRIGHSSTVFTIFVAVAFFLLLSLPFLYVSPCNLSHHRLGDLYGVESNNWSILGLKSDPFNSRVKDTVFALMEQLTQARKQGAWIAAKSIPESMHCLSMRLMEERIAHLEKYIDDGNPTPSEFEDPKLYHYAIFSDNVLAASVVVNSAVQNSKNPSLHVFHVMTDKVNFWAMQVMFKMKDYSGAHIEVKFMNFSHPLIKNKFNPKACAWAFGMNFFDLDAWRREKSTEEYHYWQNMNENRKLWKLGTLPPGLITFYSTTKVLDRSCHVLDPRFNPIINVDDIDNAAVVHFNGNMKPWLDNAIIRPLWSKYVDKENEHVQACNFNFGDG
ncbi:hypothetical protein MTR67_040211, partial [Solanum verrucosum]